ncbi:hypothetical protein [Flavobacterium sp. JAS]|uniref:hypothetical protein n=1 Tax=Flavobacterium sp. JAS TaxID=2897329 RepID=UPI001E626B9F|nr:hypothetical protein [Flavobacterium sp. JAS]MCD0471291.1 hypothetical protein [Flavobacterium sp. JAS]
MKKTLLVFIILVSLSCTKKKSTTQIVIPVKIEHQQITQNNTLTITDSIKKTFLDTLNIKKSPVKIISAKLSKTQYSDHKDIKLLYKNVSNKNIKAIRFEWYCENGFEKPASGRSFFIKGKAEGYTDDLLKPHQSRSQIWEDFSTDANTIISARAYYVVFSDGTKWNLKK